MESYDQIKMARISNNRQRQVTVGVTVQQLPWEVKNQPDPALADYWRKFEQEVAKVEQFKKEAQELRRQVAAAN